MEKLLNTWKEASAEDRLEFMQYISLNYKPLIVDLIEKKEKL